MKSEVAKNVKNLNILAKSSLAVMLAGTFTFSTPFIARAEENTKEKVETVDLQNLTYDQTNQVTSEKSTDISKENKEENVETVEALKPSLLPGDFFYFTKMVLEKIKLALTFDDVKEAELLSKFATERMAEAEALLAEGKEDLAIEAIKKAMKDMEVVGDLVDDENSAGKTSEDSKVGATEEVKPDGAAEGTTNSTTEEVKPDGAAEGTTNSTTKEVKPDGAVEGTTNATTEEVKPDGAAEGATNGTTDELETDKTTLDEIEKSMRYNIIALTAALEKVKNPVAKAALERNIVKTYEKIAKQLEKLEKKVAKKAEKISTEKTKTDQAIESTEGKVTETTNQNENAVTENSAQTEETQKTDQQNVPVQVTKPISPKHEHKEVEKETKKEERDNKHKTKHEEKLAKKEQRENQHKAKHQDKISKKEQHKAKHQEKFAKKEQRELKRVEKVHMPHAPKKPEMKAPHKPEKAEHAKEKVMGKKVELEKKEDK
jgi:hypothetical protein